MSGTIKFKEIIKNIKDLLSQSIQSMTQEKRIRHSFFNQDSH
jgi:hypothetical protein